LMTGLIYNRPQEPLRFLETAIAQIRANPEEELTWDMFVDKTKFNTLCGPPKEKGKRPKLKEKNKGKGIPLTSSGEGRSFSTNMGRLQRSPSVMKAAEVAQIPHVPIILFMGGPGGGKTRHAARVANALADQGLVHICMPDIIRSALAKYKDYYSEWKTANEHYLRGELIPNHLALALVKAEMGRHPEASAFFLEGFPREARQVEDFERQVQSVNMALILDYDEKTLREHMEKRGMGMEIIDQRIKEFKQKTLPSAKYFDDQRLLHLIPGEKDDQTIFERMRDLVRKAMSTGVPVLNSNPPSQAQTRVPTGVPIQQNGFSANGIDNESLGQDTVIEDTTAPTKDRQSECGIVASSPIGTTAKRTESVSSKENAARAQTSGEFNKPSASENNSVTSPQFAETPAKDSTTNVVPASLTASTSVPPSVLDEVPAAQKSPTLAPSKTPSREGVPSAEKSPTLIPSKTSSREGAPSLSGDSLPHGLSTNAPIILIIGAPGAQKSDIAKRTAQKYSEFVLLSMGALLRAKVAEESADELWQRIARKIDQGEPVPMKLCRELLYNELHLIGNASSGHIIEGYPRTEAQLIDLQSFLGRIDVAILIDCTEQFCLDNIARRYQTGSNARPEDDPEVARTRMTLFKQNTLPMLKALDEKGILRVVEGDSDPDTVFKDVSAVIDASLFNREESGNNVQEVKRGSTNE
ncbi:hypothetical protein Angca_007419, partial [Angiostrongylus cantonensis]